jgi:hypothetical protein
MTVDYTKFNGGGGAGQVSTGDVYARKWWQVPPTERAQAVCSIVKMMSEYDSKRQTQYQISTRLYGNSNLMGLNGLSYSKIASVNNTLKDRVSYNLVQSCIDTITSKISKNKPKPLFLTSGADYQLQRKAKKLDKFTDGIFYENQAYELGTDAFRDGCVFGDGLVHVFDHYGRVKFERVIPSEIYVDWVESFYGFPRQMHRVKNVDRSMLMDLYPSKKQYIRDADSASADLLGTYQNVADQVTVVESWHLPSGPEATDGMHCINIPNANLFEEKWNKHYFPFAKFQWSKRMYGWWGQGLAEQVQNIQLEVNKILWIIQRSMHLAGSFKILLENGSKIVKEHLTNDIGAIVSYTGQKPEYVVPNIVPMELYQHLITLKASAYEQSGISQLSATSLKPSGLDSGKALREYNDIESDRFQTIGHGYENFFLSLSKLGIGVAKDIYEQKGKYKVISLDKKFYQTIDWKEINLRDDQFYMKVYPVSSLPTDPSGRLQTIQEYIEAGFYSKRVGKRLLDFPDTEQVNTLEDSQEDYLHQILEKIVEEGDYTAPDEFDDLVAAKELVLEYIAEGKKSGLEEEKLELLRNFSVQVDTLTQAMLPPPPVEQIEGPNDQPKVRSIAPPSQENVAA